MGDKIKLTKIELTTKDGKKVELSLAEAKDLHDQLHELFGEKTVFFPSAPVIIERDRYWQPYQPLWLSGPYSSCEVKSESGLLMNYQGSAA